MVQPLASARDECNPFWTEIQADSLSNGLAIGPQPCMENTLAKNSKDAPAHRLLRHPAVATSTAAAISERWRLKLVQKASSPPNRQKLKTLELVEMQEQGRNCRTSTFESTACWTFWPLSLVVGSPAMDSVSSTSHV